MLHHAHAIKRDARLGHDRSTGLGQNPYLGAKSALSGGVACRARPLANRRRRLTGHVRHAQSPTNAEFVKVVATSEVREHAHGLTEPLDLEDL